MGDFVNPNLFNPSGWPQLWRFMQASFQPDLRPELLKIAFDATIVTLSYAVCSTFLTVCIGGLLGLLASQICWKTLLGQRSGWLFWPIRGLLAIPRSIHELLWGLFFVNIWGLDPLTAIVAIAIPFSAIAGKIFSEILDDTDQKPLEALLNSGVKPLPSLIYGLMPQAFLNLLSYSFYRFECALRSAAVLGIIGAGGLGYQIMISLQSLKYNELWTFFYALILLNGLVDWCLMRLAKPISKKPLVFMGAGLLITIAAFIYLNPDYSRITSPRSQRLWQEFTQSLFPLDFSQLITLGKPAIETVNMSILAILIAAIGGAIIAIPATATLFQPGSVLNAYSGQSQVIWYRLTTIIARFVLLIARSIPAPIWALVTLYILFPGILPGAIALGIHNLGILGRLFTEVIENLDRRPLEALKSTGATVGGIYWYGILPSTIAQKLAYTCYRWEVCMRETVIVGLVGAGGLGRLLTEQLTSFDYRSLMVTLIVFVLLTFGVDWVSQKLRQQLKKPRRHVNTGNNQL